MHKIIFFPENLKKILGFTSKFRYPKHRYFLIWPYMFLLLSIVCVALVDEENHVFGSDVYQFKTPKKSGQMAQLASESRTPKSQPSSESRTPKSILKTPVQKKDAARRKCMYSRDQARGRLGRNSRPRGRNFALTGTQGEVGVSLKKKNFFFFLG